MVTGLQPLEFTDCLLDSPEFRENLNKHEKELEKTSQQIKRIIKEVKDLLTAAKSKFICRICTDAFLGLINKLFLITLSQTDCIFELTNFRFFSIDHHNFLR